MSSPYSQKSGTFQVVLTGKDLVQESPNGSYVFQTANRRMNLSGNYRLKLTGFQGQYNAINELPLTTAVTTPYTIPTPLLMIVSPQFITNWTPDIQGPVVQWGSTMSNQYFLDNSIIPNAAYQILGSNTYLGQPLNLEFRANLNNLLQIQVRCCDLNAYAAASPSPTQNSVPESVAFDKTLASVFSAYKTVTLVLTFQFEQDF